MIQISAATEADIIAYGGTVADWCVRWEGRAAKRDGEVIGLVLLCWDKSGNLSAWVDEKEPLPAILKHRLALRTLTTLRRLGEKQISVFCDYRKTGSAMWLERLGFVPCEMTEYAQVWRCNLSK